VAKPRADRWHPREIAMLGGVIALAMAVAKRIFAPVNGDSSPSRRNAGVPACERVHRTSLSLA